MFKETLGRIVESLANKARNMVATDVRDLSDWLDTEEGKAWDALGVKVYDCLEAGAEAKPFKKRIKFPDGAELTVAQTSLRLAEQLQEDQTAVREHVVMWLEEASMPDDPDMDGDQEEAFEKATDRWVKEERAKMKSWV